MLDKFYLINLIKNENHPTDVIIFVYFSSGDPSL